MDKGVECFRKSCAPPRGQTQKFCAPSLKKCRFLKKKKVIGEIPEYLVQSGRLLPFVRLLRVPTQKSTGSLHFCPPAPGSPPPNLGGGGCYGMLPSPARLFF